ncbi:MAG: hypothetical protein JNL62_05015 [Bryobacterales bacterium]|nr:hypothetical protein [Bryobacterales bacterium]
MAHPDLERLLNSSLDFAHNQQEKRGGFLPFAAIVDRNGNVALQAVDPGEERPTPQTMMDRFASLLRRLASTGEAVAISLCYDSMVSSREGEPKKDAIAVALDHAAGESIIVFEPYRKKFLRGYVYDALIAIPGERNLFPSDQPHSPEGLK